MRAKHAGPTRVHAQDVVIIRPALHQQIDVPPLQGIVEGRLGVIGRAAKVGGSGTDWGHDGVIAG
jgi:hypothetical protein